MGGSKLFFLLLAASFALAGMVMLVVWLVRD
jgi:hypothetical protein